MLTHIVAILAISYSAMAVPVVPSPGTSITVLAYDPAPPPAPVARWQSVEDEVHRSVAPPAVVRVLDLPPKPAQNKPVKNRKHKHKHRDCIHAPVKVCV